MAALAKILIADDEEIFLLSTPKASDIFERLPQKD